MLLAVGAVGAVAGRRLGRAVVGALGVLCALSALAASPTYGAGATYTVLNCHSLNRDAGADLFAHNPYDSRAWCSAADREYSVQINNTGNADNGRLGRATWNVGSSALGIVGVDVEGKLRRDAGHKARLMMTDESARETYRVGTGDTGPTGFSRYAWSGVGQPQFVAMLLCDQTGGCNQSDQAKAWVREAKLTIRDATDPTYSRFDGTLIAGGWLRGGKELVADASDSGSGISEIVATVNGEELALQAGSCSGSIPKTSYASRMAPCTSERQLRLAAVDTAQPPFQNGQNALSVCAEDFAGNRSCQSRTVSIDNAPPSLAFANGQDPDDPELIRAPISDPHSGVASARIYYREVGSSLWQPLETELVGAELRARVESASVPPGDYEFRAEATDVAGNSAETSLRQDGQPKVLTFPLRADVDLRAHLEPGGATRQTIGYGRDWHVAGRLLAASGVPLAGEEVTVVEYFGEGALIDRRVRTVATNGSGRWASKLPAGPSREVTAYFDGAARYLAADARAGRLQVRSKASFKTSRKQVPEGGRILFKGRVGHFGARIPVGGKLIELQVRERVGRWQTVREAFYTKPSGGYRLGYRFGRFYQSDALFKFRVKVAREQGWPYKAPARSRSRRVVLRAR